MGRRTAESAGDKQDLDAEFRLLREASRDRACKRVSCGLEEVDPELLKRWEMLDEMGQKVRRLYTLPIGARLVALERVLSEYGELESARARADEARAKFEAETR